jgi:hypothetical protein
MQERLSRAQPSRAGPGATTSPPSLPRGEPRRRQLVPVILFDKGNSSVISGSRAPGNRKPDLSGTVSRAAGLRVPAAAVDAVDGPPPDHPPTPVQDPTGMLMGCGGGRWLGGWGGEGEGGWSSHYRTDGCRRCLFAV